MDTSIIDLCDSDDDNNNQAAAATASGNQKQAQVIKISSKPSNTTKPKVFYNPPSSSSSSSSSSDEELWNAGGFLNSKPKKEEVVRKGNYFREVREKCLSYGSSSTTAVANKKKNGVANSSSSSSSTVLQGKKQPPMKQPDMEEDDDDDEEFDEDVRNYSPPKKKSGKNSSSSSNNNDGGGGKIQAKAVAKTVECIEIDLSSSDDDDDCGNNKNKNGSDNPAMKNKKKNGEDYESPFRIRKRSFVTTTAAAAKNDTTAAASAGMASKPPPKKTKVDYITYNNNNNSRGDDDNDNDDDEDSSTTIPLPENESFPTAAAAAATKKPQQRVQEEIDLSMDLSDDDEVEVTNDPFNNNDDDVQMMNDNGNDDDDDDSSSDGDKKPSHKKNYKMQIMEAAVKSRNDPINIDSDDSSSSSDSMDLFTPRPMKKKTNIAQKKKTSFTIDADANTATTTNNKANSCDKKKCPDSTKSTTSTTSSKLLTPREFSPATTSPFGPTFAAATASKLRVPTPAIPAMSATLVKEIGGKLYPDLTHNFIIALTSQARRARHNSYQRASFDSALRSIVVIALHMRPLRSAEATRRMKGVGGNFYDLLKESVAGSKSKKPFEPKKGKFTCVAAAALVGLLEMEERVQKNTAGVASSANGSNDATTSSFSMEDLILSINSLLDSRANANLSQSAQQYLNKDNLDPGWGQVKKLCSTNAAADLGGPFMKERKRKDACPSGRVFELLDSGRLIATKLRELALSGPFEPGPLRQLPDESVDQEFGNVTMSMDFREGGGGGRSLHKMCDQLDIRGVPYVVRELKIADYIFFVGEKLAPILIERKTADDVAGSLHDGRWERQQRSMRKAQYVLGGGSARRCQICYIIEGDASKRTVHGGNVGRRTWFQSVDDVENAIEKLPSLGFSVMRSKSTLDTIGILAKVVQDVSWKAKNGNIDVMFTYEQFLSRVKKLGEDKGDPPTDRAHQNPAPPVVVNTNFMSNTSNTATVAAASAAEDDDVPFSPQRSDSPGGCGLDTDTQQENNNNAEQVAELKKLSMARLKEMLKERDEKTGGKKEELISRLLKPRKPELLILRARRKEYVPKVPSSNAALMVALLLNHIPGTQGLTKERLMVLAEETGVSKESMSGDGSSFYDGWSGMKQLQEGDPALVRREKGHRYSLTTQPPESAGVAVANALHIVAHREGLCTCGNPPNGV